MSPKSARILRVQINETRYNGYSLLTLSVTSSFCWRLCRI